MAGDGRHDVLGNLAGVEGIRTFVGDCAQGLGEGRVLENGPDRLRLAVSLVEIGAGDRIVLKEFLLRQEPVEAREIVKPSSARRAAGSITCGQESLPQFLCAVSRRRGVPGTPTERPPTTAS